MRFLLFRIESLLGLLFLFLSGVEVLCQGVDVKDGIELSVTVDIRSEGSAAVVKCLLLNKTSEPIEYERVSESHRLQFWLFNSNGDLLPMEEEWMSVTTLSPITNRYHTPQKFLMPGVPVEFDLPVDLAYGDRWKSGVWMVVTWEPGKAFDTEDVVNLSKGRGLKVELPLNGGGRPNIDITLLEILKNIKEGDKSIYLRDRNGRNRLEDHILVYDSEGNPFLKKKTPMWEKIGCGLFLIVICGFFVRRFYNTSNK